MNIAPALGFQRGVAKVMEKIQKINENTALKCGKCTSSDEDEELVASEAFTDSMSTCRSR